MARTDLDYITIEKLGVANYATWAVEMQDILRAKGLWNCISDTKLKALDSDDEWKEKQQKAVGIIAQGLEREIRREYTDSQYEDPKVLWDKIKADRQEVVKLDSNYLRKELYNIKL